jgi:hypothetical protein
VIDFKKQAMLRFFKRLNPSILRHVNLGCEIVCELALLVEDGTYMQLVPERLSILLVVQNFDGGFALLSNGCSNLGNNRSRCRFTLQAFK